MSSNCSPNQLACEKFKLEVFFAKYEFVAKHLLCCSDGESISMKDLLALADQESLRLWEELRLGYTECRGMPLLRAEIAKMYPGMTAENVVCFAGAEEGIFCALKTLLSSNDHAIVITPCYQSLKSIPESLCSISTLDLDPRNNWELDLAEVRNLIRQGVTKAIVCNFPHNPTGTSLSPERQKEFVDLASEFDLWLFCDEVYRGVERNNNALPPISSIYNKGISLGAVSKVYGLAGLRIGWICMHDVNLLIDIADNKHYLSICNGAPCEVLALIALRASDTVVGNIRSIILRNEKYLNDFMQRHPSWASWVRPMGGCCGFMKLHLPDGIDLATVAERLVQEFGVLILPGENFPSTNPDNRQLILEHFRIGLGRANFTEVLDAFETAFPIVMRSLGYDGY